MNDGGNYGVACETQIGKMSQDSPISKHLKLT